MCAESLLSDFLQEARALVDAELEARLPRDGSRLAEAIRYAALGPGKRVRPSLLIALADALELSRETVAGPAAAVEMVHAFSLVHDDLPALDDDRLRRGRETVHVAFDQATAILAGDALLNLAFGVLAEAPSSVSADRRCLALAALARAVGERGMIGGQMLDLIHAQDRDGDLETLERIHRGKTGSLMRLCGELAAIYSGVDADRGDGVAAACEDLGLMFQIRDDLLDVSRRSDELGKTAGKDEAQNKLTYPSLLGAEGAGDKLSELQRLTAESFAGLPGPTDALIQLVDFVAGREH